MNSTLLSLLLLFALFGCGDDKNQSHSTDSHNSSSDSSNSDNNNSGEDNQDNSNSGGEDQGSSDDECNKTRSLLSDTYESDFGDIELNISSDDSVEGSYSYDGYEGTIEGSLDKKSLTIEGTYYEIKDRFLLPDSEENGTFKIKFSITDCETVKVLDSEYLEEGEEEPEPWGIKPKK